MQDIKLTEKQIQNWRFFISAMKLALTQGEYYSNEDWSNCAFGKYLNAKGMLMDQRSVYFENLIPDLIKTELGVRHNDESYERIFCRCNQTLEECIVLAEKRFAELLVNQSVPIRKDEFMTSGAVFTPSAQVKKTIRLIDIKPGKWYSYNNGQELFTRSGDRFIRYMSGEFQQYVPYGTNIDVEELTDGVLGFTVKV